MTKAGARLTSDGQSARTSPHQSSLPSRSQQSALAPIAAGGEITRVDRALAQQQAAEFARIDIYSSRRLGNLWQVPLLIGSLALWGVAAYLFVDARPALAFVKKLSVAKQLLGDERPEAAQQSLTRLVTSEKLPPEQEARVHLLLAESIGAAQKQRADAPAAQYSRIIEELQLAQAQGARPTGEMLQRIGECYEALGKPAEAAAQYRQAMAIEPARALRLQRKVIDLQMAAGDWTAVEASLDAYLATAGASDAERAWAENQKAQLLIDHNQTADAQRLLEDALRLDADPIAQAQTKYRLGLCAWKSGKTDEAQALIAAARTVFNNQHPLDPAAAVALGSIARDKNDLAKAVALFDSAIAAKPDSGTALRAHLARAACRIQKHEDDAAIADLRDAVDLALLAPQALKAQAAAAMQHASKNFAAKDSYQAAIDVMGFERTLEPNLTADYYARLATACEKRAEQIEQSTAEANGPERVRRAQLVRDFRNKSAESYLALSRALAATGDKSYGQSLWKAVDLLDAAGDRQAIVAALELWVTERADDPIAPDALARLGKTYEAIGQADAAISAYQRLQGAYPKAAAAAKAAVSLAELYVAKDASRLPLATKVLSIAIASTDSDVRRDALLELGRLQARAGQDAQAIEPLEQFAKDFASDSRIGEVYVMTAECAAHMAAKIDVHMVSASASSGETPNGVSEMTQAVAAKKQHLQKAASMYAKAADFYRTTPPTRDEDRRCATLASMHRADCAYELGDYEAAVKLYEQAAREINDAPQVVAANIQIANAYFALHKPDEARRATEQAKQLLQQLPGKNGADATVPMPAAYFEQWLKWTGSGGTW